MPLSVLPKNLSSASFYQFIYYKFNKSYQFEKQFEYQKLRKLTSIIIMNKQMNNFITKTLLFKHT